MMEYNTTRSNLILREYGRNFHKLVDYVGNIKSKEERNKMSKTLVEMMKLTHPSFKDQNEIDAKMWDDLYIMSDYSLDIESPYPKPNKKSESEFIFSFPAKVLSLYSPLSLSYFTNALLSFCSPIPVY